MDVCQYCLSGDVKGYWVRFFACCKNLPKSLASDYRILKYLLLIEENIFFCRLASGDSKPGSLPELSTFCFVSDAPNGYWGSRGDVWVT